MTETEKKGADDLIEETAAEKPEPAVSDPESEFSEQYKKLPVWKQVVFLVLCLGGMTAVIMIINFIVDFGAELLKALFR